MTTKSHSLSYWHQSIQHKMALGYRESLTRAKNSRRIAGFIYSMEPKKQNKNKKKRTKNNAATSNLTFFSE